MRVALRQAHVFSRSVKEDTCNHPRNGTQDVRRTCKDRDHVADEGGRGCSSQGPKDKIRDLSLSGSKICEGVVIQDTGDRVAHRSHDVLNRALGMICIGTVSTFLVGGLADAPDRR